MKFSSNIVTCNVPSLCNYNIAYYIFHFLNSDLVFFLSFFLFYFILSFLFLVHLFSIMAFFLRSSIKRSIVCLPMTFSPTIKATLIFHLQLNLLFTFIFLHPLICFKHKRVFFLSTIFNQHVEFHFTVKNIVPPPFFSNLVVFLLNSILQNNLHT
jgi:hypothetical protein